MTEYEKEPLEGFHITNYDTDKKLVTIEVHRDLLNNPNSIERLKNLIVEIIKDGPNVDGVSVEPRKD